MKVLFWTASFWPHLGGLEVISCELVRSLKDQGVTFEIVSCLPPGQPPPAQTTWEGVAVHWLRSGETDLTDFAQIARVRHQVLKHKRRFRPDLIHVNGTNSALPLLLLTREEPDPPWLTTLHGDWENYRPEVMSQLFAQSSWISACSQDTLALVHRFAPSTRAKSSAILNALPEMPLAPRPLQRPPVLLCAGRLSAEKNYDLAVRSLVELPGVRLRIAGDGPERAALEQLAHRLGVDQRVELLGRLERAQLLQEMRQATALLCPSRVEGFGLVALEAALAETPVLAARTGGLVEVVAHEQTGLLVESLEVPAWRAAIQRLLDNPGWSQQLGTQARRRARQKFRWQDYADGYLELYRRLAGLRPVRARPHSSDKGTK